jgi:hypothetical protein
MNYHKAQDFDICALNHEFSSVNICVLTIYRAPTGNFNYFIYKIDAILHTLYTPTLDFITCGDIFIYSFIHTHSISHNGVQLHDTKFVIIVNE